MGLSMGHNTAWLTASGMPLRYFYDEFSFNWNYANGNYDGTLYDMDLIILILGINIIVLASFSFVYVYLCNSLFRLLSFGLRRVTNTTAAILFSMFSFFLCIRSWSISPYLLASATNEVPLHEYHYGFPVKIGAEGTITLLLNYLILITTSTVCAIICAFINKMRTHSSSTESKKRAAKVVDQGKK
ncbi:MAG: hypothetical protein JXR23_06485 [Pontiellaceae bacterium]|nr:hypothetical protein [Pontiellaceae bacterium]